MLLLLGGELPQWEQVVNSADWYARFERVTGATRRKGEIVDRQQQLRDLRQTGTPEGDAEMVSLVDEESRVNRKTRELIEASL